MKTTRDNQEYYTKKLWQVFYEIHLDGVNEKLEAYCADVIREIIHFKQFRKYRETRKDSADRLLAMVSKLTLAIDLFALSFSADYKRTQKTMEIQRRNLLDGLLRNPFLPKPDPKTVNKE